MATVIATRMPGLATGGWPGATLRLGALAALILLLFVRDAADMAGLWWNVSTYNHCLVIPPLLAWLVRQRWPELRRLEPVAWWPGLVWLAGAAFLWLLGELGGVALVRHAALVAMLQGAVLAMLGPQASAGLLFPLAYAVFMIPVGEELVPALQMLTADLSMAMLGWSGVPAHIEGVFITTPTGYFEVAEACSGVMFLIAMVALGVLVAHLCFATWQRRLAFLVLCVVVPVLANSVRAWGTMFIAHHTSNAFAAGFDHILYGWFFFAFVMAMVLAIGWRFFDRGVDDPLIDADAVRGNPLVARAMGWQAPALPTALAGAAMVLAAPGWALWTGGLPGDANVQVTVAPPAGWQAAAVGQAVPWQPRQDGADAAAMRRLADGRGHVVDVYVAAYAGQAEGRELVGYGQGAFDPASAWSWSSPGAAVAAGRSDVLVAPGPVTREAVTFYRIGDRTTGSAARVKLATVMARLSGSSAPASVIIVSAERQAGRPARAAIDAFLADVGSFDTWADRQVQSR